MLKNKLVSIVIPFYNRYDLLEKTLLSVKAQDYDNYEVIMVDDCSQNSADISSFKDQFNNHNFIYKRLEKNSGPGKARSVGRKIASGAYVAYLDSDDLWEPQFLSSTIKKLESMPNIAMVFTNILIKNGDKRIQRLHIGDGIYNFYDLIFRKKIYWATAAAVWRTDVSFADNWKPIRDHEDYVHDILSLQYNPNIYHISQMLCVVNKNSELGVKRSNKEMLLSLNVLLKSSTLRQQLKKLGFSADFLKFVLLRIKRRKMQIKDAFRILKTYFNALSWTDSYFATTIKFIKSVK